MTAFGGLRRKPAIFPIHITIERHLHETSRDDNLLDPLCMWNWLHTTDWPHGICPYCEPERAAEAAERIELAAALAD